VKTIIIYKKNINNSKNNNNKKKNLYFYTGIMAREWNMVHQKSIYMEHKHVMALVI